MSNKTNKKNKRIEVDYSLLEGPAKAGQRGGGKDAPPVKQPPLGSEEAIAMGLGVKTNVKGGHGPKKTATTIIKDSGGGKKGKKGKKDK